MSQSAGKNNNFLLLTVDNDGALTVNRLLTIWDLGKGVRRYYIDKEKRL